MRLSVFASCVVSLGLASCVVSGEEPGRVVPLANAHAHNDYEHKRPLMDALDHGFCSVEADVFLTGDRLLVGHTRKDLKPDRTLERLYLDPLRERVRANNGRVYKGGPVFYLLIDVKSDLLANAKASARATYAVLDRVLRRYDDILSVTRHGKHEPKAVTVVVSGDCDRDTISAQDVRYAAIDGRPPDLNSDAPADLIPWISDRWGAHFRWRGDGPMPQNERDKLQQFVRKAHQRGRLVRFWATPDKVAFWKELRSCGVDLINTDDLAGLQRFLLEQADPARQP